MDSKAPLSLMAIIALSIVLSPQKSFALPFHKNCASLQQYHNARYTTKASDFENSRMDMSLPGGYTCTNGYAVTNTSHGKEICQANLFYCENTSACALGGNPGGIGESILLSGSCYLK
jgi:hypothetical protein